MVYFDSSKGIIGENNMFACIQQNKNATNTKISTKFFYRLEFHHRCLGLLINKLGMFLELLMSTLNIIILFS